MQNGKNHDSQNTGTATPCDSDVVFIRQLSMPVVRKPATPKPIILRPRKIHKPDLPSNTMVSDISVNTVASLDAAMLYRMEIVDCSNKGDGKVYILDQSDFVPLLDNLEGTNGASVGSRKAVESTENIEEILVGSNQVQLLNEPNKPSEYGWNSVCRTCLTLTDNEKCKKIFDSKDREESNKLREKLAYIAGEINYKASFNATICQKCVTLIEIAYTFKKQVQEVEDRIRKKLNEDKGNLFIDLRCLLNGNARAEVSCETAGSSNDRRRLNEQQYEENMRNTARAQGEGGIVSSQDVIVIDDDGNGTKDNVSHISSQSKYLNLEDYLTTRGERLDRIRRSAKIYQRRSIIPAKPFNGIVTNHCGPSNETDYKAPEVPCEKSVDNVQDRAQSSSLPKLEAAVTIDPETAGCDKSGGHSASFEAHLARRQERLKKFNYTNQFSNSNLRVLKNQKRPLSEELTLAADDGQVDKTESPAYKYLFNTRETTKKKPEVPKTWNLFDEEHDKYFKNLVGEAGCYMVRKWSRFVRRCGRGNRWHGTSEGPFLCHYCGVVCPSMAKFSHHTNLHSIKDEMCVHCGKFVKGGIYLRYHIEAKHMPPSYECKQCGKKFHLASNLAGHISRKHKGRSDTFQCQLCGKLLMNSRTLNHHLLRLHNTSSQRFTCDICDKSWPCKNDFNRHRKKHISFQRYSCPSCPKTFLQKENLKQHQLQIHEGISKWKCVICDRLMARKESLKKHLRVLHNLILSDRQLKETASEQEGECSESVTKLTINEQTECDIACEIIVDEAKNCDAH